MSKKTPLYDGHISLGAKMVEFAGFLMPIEYSGLKAEHLCVRNNAAFFDVSHMGEFEVTGRQAVEFLNYILSNDIAKMKELSTQYNFLLNEAGNIIDDLIVYKFNNESFILVVNASNMEKDFVWIQKQAERFEVDIVDISNNVAMIALQGPKALKFLSEFTKYDLSTINKFEFAKNVDIFNKYTMVSRTGYTGEDGFEIYTDKFSVLKIWDGFVREGRKSGVIPAGLGARDTLRFQAGLPLYGNELSEGINPYEANLGMFVDLNKDDFIGIEALKHKVKNGTDHKIIAFQMSDRAIPRHGYEVYSKGEKIGYVTTGYMLPDNKKSVGFALIRSEHANIGDEIQVMIRKALKPAIQIAKREFKKY